MKKWVLNLWLRNLENPLQAGKLETVEGDNLVEVCAKFVLLIARLQQKEHEEEIEILRKEFIPDDDIPF